VRPSDVQRLRRGILRGTSYRAVMNTMLLSTRPLDTLRRYVSSNGEYPWTLPVRTPTGTVPITLPHPHDLRTVNEVFFRRDYGAGKPRVVVDIGANIGVSAAYFLTRSTQTRVYCWEPLPTNLETLHLNTRQFADRITVVPHAVAPERGQADFRVEAVGRYSGLAAHYEHDLDTTTRSVWCDAIRDVLGRVLDAEGFIDLVKFDTEGSERALISSVPAAMWPRIGLVHYEDAGTVRRRTGVEMSVAGT
jgi:FkbM family methyltransferase